MKNLNQCLNYRISVRLLLVVGTALLTIAGGISIPVTIVQDTSTPQKQNTALFIVGMALA
jgi:hypothetical protein